MGLKTLNLISISYLEIKRALLQSPSPRPILDISTFRLFDLRPFFRSSSSLWLFLCASSLYFSAIGWEELRDFSVSIFRLLVETHPTISFLCLLAVGWEFANCKGLFLFLLAFYTIFSFTHFGIAKNVWFQFDDKNVWFQFGIAHFSIWHFGILAFGKISVCWVWTSILFVLNLNLVYWMRLLIHIVFVEF